METSAAQSSRIGTVHEIAKKIGSHFILKFWFSKSFKRNNKIKSLPSSMSKMVNLERLSLDNNEITSIPKGLGKLPNLLELDLARKVSL